MNAELLPIAAGDCVVRGTHRQKGRTEWLAPGRYAVRQLHYGRVILDGGQAITFNTGERETGLIALGGAATVTVNERIFRLTPYDALYVPRATAVCVSTAEGCDLAEVSAPVRCSLSPLTRFARTPRCTSSPAAPTPPAI